MDEYKVGDKAIHSKYGVGTVREVSYVFMEFDGVETHVRTDSLKPVPKFEFGDVVTAYSRKHIVKSGVYVDGDGTRSYVIMDVELKEFHMVPEEDIL